MSKRKSLFSKDEWKELASFLDSIMECTDYTLQKLINSIISGETVFSIQLERWIDKFDTELDRETIFKMVNVKKALKKVEIHISTLPGIGYDEEVEIKLFEFEKQAMNNFNIQAI